MATEIRELNASSKQDNLLVVRNNTPLWYSRRRKNTPTIAFLKISFLERFSKKISASSSKIAAPQIAASSRMFCKFFSRESGVVPSSPTVTM